MIDSASLLAELSELPEQCHPAVLDLMADDYLLTPEQAALRLQLDPDTLRNWRSQQKGPQFVKLGGRGQGSVRYRRADLRAWIEAHVATGTSVYMSDMVLTAPGAGITRVSTALGDVSYLGGATTHPYVMQNDSFIISSAYAPCAYGLVFGNPYADIRWLTVFQALARPWADWPRRQALLGAYLQTPAGYQMRVQLERDYAYHLQQIPADRYGSQPDMLATEDVLEPEI